MELVTALIAAVQIYLALIFVRAIFSWLPYHHRQNQFYAFLFRITEPVLAPVRRIMPPMQGADLSALVVILLGSVLVHALKNMLR